MSKKNVKIWVVLIISVQFLALVSGLTNTNAWKNGVTPSGNVTEAYLSSWRVKGHYGTHDWIAESALIAVKQDGVAWNKWKDKDGLNFWTERRTVIFLIGTEEPDMDFNQLTITLNGKLLKGHKTAGRHHIRFRETWPPAYYMSIANADIMNQLNEYKNLAEQALRDGKCDLAAFYMGCVAHFIGDLSNFFHTIGTVDIRKNWGWSWYNPHPPMWHAYDNEYTHRYMISRLHESLEGSVLLETKIRVKNGFFTYPENFDVSPGGVKNPLEIAIVTAFNTRWDTEANIDQALNPLESGILEGKCNAQWMFHHTYTINLAQKVYFYKNIRSQTDVEGIMYRNRLQKSLTEGVKAVAGTLDYFGQLWNTETSKTCIGCITEKPPEDSMKFSNKMMIGVSIFIFMGIAGAFFQTIMLTQIQSAIRKEKSLGV